MTMRSTTADAARRSQTSSSRATIREVDDDHLMQEIKMADVLNSESPSNFERPQPLGFTCVPLKQQESQQGGQGGGAGGAGGSGGGGNGGGGGWSSSQPKGESAEGMISYANGQRGHPVMSAMDDRRVRPYGQKEGEGQFYSPDGSGQTIYHRRRQDGKDGLYLLTLDDQQQQSSGGGGAQARDSSGGGSGSQQQNRMISIRHVQKKKQQRTASQAGGAGGGGGGASGASVQATAASSGGGGDMGIATGQSNLPDGSKSNYKHEGDSINTEVKLDVNDVNTTTMKGKINFNDSGGVVGFYDSSKKDWLHHDGSGATHSMRADKQHSHIKHDGGHVWSDGTPKKSKPFVVESDPCS